MQTITILSHTDANGALTLHLDTNLSDANVEVTVIVQPSHAEALSIGTDDWPPGFFEETFGAFRDTPLVREDQGTYEIRDELQ